MTIAPNPINMIWGVQRWTHKLTFGGTGTWDPTYPLTNLNTVDLSLQAQSGPSSPLALASTQFTAAYDVLRPTRLIAVVGHNFSPSGSTLSESLIKATVYDDLALTSSPYNTGWIPVWDSVYPADTLEWEDGRFWTGSYSREEVTGYTWIKTFWLPQMYAAGGFKIEVDDQANADTVLRIAQFEAGAGFQGSVNFDDSSAFGYGAPLTRVQRALGGAKYFDPAQKPRVFTGTVNFITEDEALAVIFEAWRQNDIHTPFVLIPNPSDTVHKVRRNLYVRFTENGISKFKYSRINGRMSFNFELEEVL